MFAFEPAGRGGARPELAIAVVSVYFYAKAVHSYAAYASPKWV